MQNTIGETKLLKLSSQILLHCQSKQTLEPQACILFIF
jgi:hypothetical protein